MSYVCLGPDIDDLLKFHILVLDIVPVLGYSTEPDFGPKISTFSKVENFLKNKIFIIFGFEWRVELEIDRALRKILLLFCNSDSKPVKKFQSQGGSTLRLHIT